MTSEHTVFLWLFTFCSTSRLFAYVTLLCAMCMLFFPVPSATAPRPLCTFGSWKYTDPITRIMYITKSTEKIATLTGYCKTIHIIDKIDKAQHTDRKPFAVCNRCDAIVLMGVLWTGPFGNIDHAVIAVDRGNYTAGCRYTVRIGIHQLLWRVCRWETTTDRHRVRLRLITAEENELLWNRRSCVG